MKKREEGGTDGSDSRMQMDQEDTGPSSAQTLKSASVYQFWDVCCCQNTGALRKWSDI